MEPYGVYIHIPFCVHKCDYCAFATWTDRHHLTERYLAALMTDIERAVEAGMHPATSIFVGGGTPSMVPADQLAAVIAAVPTRYDAGEPPEVTVECNPDDVTEAQLRAYRGAGVNRISVGVQSMADHVLGTLGRRHQRSNVERAVAALRAVAMPSFNLDLIYGARGESIDDWLATVETVIGLAPDHISAYSLTVEAGTPLAAQPDRHPDDDDQAHKYELVDAMLEGAGYRNYEISNWSLPGHRSRHHQLYWRQQNYRGFGSAAHSHQDGHRWWNLRTPERYLKAVETNQSTAAAGETLDAATRQFERLELLLRTDDGVPLAALNGDELAGLIERFEHASGPRWRLTRRGRLLANEVSLRLILDSDLGSGGVDHEDGLLT